MTNEQREARIQAVRKVDGLVSSPRAGKIVDALAALEPQQDTYIGSVRRKLFSSFNSRWNGLVRDVTASCEKNEEQCEWMAVMDGIAKAYGEVELISRFRRDIAPDSPSVVDALAALDRNQIIDEIAGVVESIVIPYPPNVDLLRKALDVKYGINIAAAVIRGLKDTPAAQEIAVADHEFEDHEFVPCNGDLTCCNEPSDLHCHHLDNLGEFDCENPKWEHRAPAAQEEKL